MVSFGTSFDDTREKNIHEIERSIQREFPEYSVYTAFTSNMIRRKLAERNIHIMDTTMALEQMHQDGVTKVYLLPTHLLYGEEYEKLEGLVEEKREAFQSISIAKPLLADHKDIAAVLKALTTNIKREPEEALILMGHGTEHYYNAVYGQANFIARELDLEQVYVCTVEAYPSFEDALLWCQRNGISKCVLSSFMLVAGDHSVNDMACLDDSDSLASVLSANGIEVRSLIKGLGEYEEIKQIYKNHLEEILHE